MNSLSHYLQGLYIPGGAEFLPSTVVSSVRCVVKLTNKTTKQIQQILTRQITTLENCKVKIRFFMHNMIYTPEN